MCLGEMIKVGDDMAVDWPLKVVVCLKTGGLLWLFHCASLKKRGLNVRTTSLFSVVRKIYAKILD